MYNCAKNNQGFVSSFFCRETYAAQFRRDDWSCFPRGNYWIISTRTIYSWTIAPPIGALQNCIATFMHGDTMLWNEEKQFLHLLNNQIFAIHPPIMFMLHIITLCNMSLNYNNIPLIIPNPLACALISMCDTTGNIRNLEISVSRFI